jgi:hypothetical protein
MIEIDWTPDREKLRQFGWISLGGFAVIGGVLGWRLGWRLGWFESGNWFAPGVFWGVGVVSAILAVVRPMLLKPLYLLLSAISAVIGPIVATAIMILIFFLVFLPLGLIFRAMGRDELCRKPDPEAASYWSSKPEIQAPDRYFRQY